MNGEIITTGEMEEAGRLADTVMRIGIQHGLDGELADVYNFLSRLRWKGMNR